MLAHLKKFLLQKKKFFGILNADPQGGVICAGACGACGVVMGVGGVCGVLL